MTTCWFGRGEIELFFRTISSSLMIRSEWFRATQKTLKGARICIFIEILNIRRLFTLAGRDLQRVGSSSIVMVLAKGITRLWVVEACFVTQMGVGLKATLKRMVYVMHYMRRWGRVYPGLVMAWKDRIPQLIAESYSKLLIDMTTYECNLGGIVSILVRRIYNILSLDWHVQVLLTLREGNWCANWLANYSLSLYYYSYFVVESPPNDIHSLLFDDIFGAFMPRSVQLTS